MTNSVKYGLVALAVAVVYVAGYKHAESEGEAVLESLKVQHAQAIIDAQDAEKEKYEAQIKGLVGRLDALSIEHSNRMRELQNFRERETDHRTCSSQRDRLARIAVELEGVASRAIVLITGGTK